MPAGLELGRYTAYGRSNIDAAAQPLVELAISTTMLRPVAVSASSVIWMAVTYSLLVRSAFSRPRKWIPEMCAPLAPTKVSSTFAPDREELERSRRVHLERGATTERATLPDEPDASVHRNSLAPRHVEGHIGRDVDAAGEIGSQFAFEIGRRSDTEAIPARRDENRELP